MPSPWDRDLPCSYWTELPWRRCQPNATNSGKKALNKTPETTMTAQITIALAKLIQFPVLAFSSKLVSL
jgi:hypothetical protein